MRIDGWEIDAFGPISGWNQHGLAEHGVVVIAGDNETGKSALFEFLTTALFGFAPATAANHPYSPWSGGFPGGALLASLSDGRGVRIARRLTSNPRGAIEIDGHPHDLANRSVAWVGGLARVIFTNLHAVTQEDALGMDPRTWQSVEDRMLGGSSFDFLRPAREAVAQLDQDRQALWRPDRRGRPKTTELRERLSALRGELRPASGRRAEIEAKQARLVEIAERLEAVERGAEGLQAIEVMLERDATLAPIVRRARRAAALDAEAASLVANDDFGPDPRAARSELRDAVTSNEQRLGEIDAEIEQLEESLEIAPVHTTALARRDSILELQAEIPLHVEDQKRIEQMSSELQREGGGFAQLAERVLDRELDAEALATLRALRIAESRGRFEAWTVAVADADYRAVERRHAAETAERAQREREAVGDVPDPAQAHGRVQTLLELDRAEALSAGGDQSSMPFWRFWVAPAVALAGVAAIIVGVVVGDAIVAGVGASLTAGATVDLTRIVMVRRRSGGRLAAVEALRKRSGLEPGLSAADALEAGMRQRDAARRAAEIDQRLAAANVAIEDAARREDEAGQAVATARDAWLELLPGVSIAPVQLQRPRETLLRDVEELRESLSRTHALEEDRDIVRERVDLRLSRLQSLHVALGLDPAADVVQAVAELGRLLDAAEKVKSESEAAAADIAKLRKERRDVGDARDAADGELAQLEGRLAQIDSASTDPDAGLDRLERARTSRAEAARARADLDRETPNWRERAGGSAAAERRAGWLGPGREGYGGVARPGARAGRDRGGAGGAARRSPRARPAGAAGLGDCRRRAGLSGRAPIAPAQGGERLPGQHHGRALRPPDRRRLHGRSPAPARAASRQGLSRRRGASPQPRHAAADLSGAAPGDGGPGGGRGRRAAAAVHGRDVRELGPVAHRPRHGRAARDRPKAAGVPLHRRPRVGRANQRAGGRGRGRHAWPRRLTTTGSPWPR